MDTNISEAYQLNIIKKKVTGGPYNIEEFKNKLKNNSRIIIIAISK